MRPAAGKSTKEPRLKCARRTRGGAAKLHSNPAQRQRRGMFSMKHFRSSPQGNKNSRWSELGTSSRTVEVTLHWFSVQVPSRLQKTVDITNVWERKLLHGEYWLQQPEATMRFITTWKEVEFSKNV